MSLIGLAGLTVVMVALLALGVVAAMGARRVAAAGSLALCGVGAALAVAVLLDGAAPALLVVPLGPPGAAMTLAIDGLSAFFLLLVLASGGAVCAAALDAAAAPFQPVLIGTMVFTVLAGDGFALVLGLELIALATFAALLAANEAAAARVELGGAVLAGVCLVAALALLGGGGWGFSAMRVHAPDGWRAGVALVLVLVGAGSRAMMPPAPGLSSGLATAVVLYVVIRVLFDLCGPATPLWWCFIPLLLGAGVAVLGAFRATLADDLRSILGWATVANTGAILVGLGVGLAARAVDLVPLAGLALGAALLLALAHALFATLLLLGAGAVEAGAGTRRLDRLGGLVQSMPVTTGCMLAGAAALAALPPTAGFAGQWTLFQAIFGAPRAGGLGLQLVMAGVVAALGLAAALRAAASVRLVGVALLGRPRSPRASAAVEAKAGVHMAMVGLAIVSALVGLFPGAVLALAGPAVRLLTGAVQAEAPGYVAPAIAVLLALAGAVAVRGMGSGTQGVPVWDSGAEPPPPWLPFGDPLTQYGGASLAQPLRRVLGGGFKDFSVPSLAKFFEPAARPVLPTVRQALAAMAVIVVLALLVIVVAEQL